jgi:hypothetical protein
MWAMMQKLRMCFIGRHLSNYPDAGRVRMSAESGYNRTMTKLQAAILLFLAGSFGLVVPAWGSKTRIYIDPGPSVITEEEQALEPDPAAGVEHGVTLVREAHRNDAFGSNSEVQQHVRAKIFTNEARDLANVEIPLNPDDKLTGWWGKTLLPDGRVLELEEKGLFEQQLARVGRYRVRSLKGALPGVVPGSVIDYGYTVKAETAPRTSRVVLQRQWPVREFRYRWKPAEHLPSAYRIYAAEGLDIEVSSNRQSVLVVGRDLPAVPEEPYMPPDHEVRASVIFYYLRQEASLKGFWKQYSKRIDRQSRMPQSDDVVGQVMASIQEEPGASLDVKLKNAYDWISENVDNPLVTHTGKSKGLSVASVGSIDPIDMVFIQVARRLGAEAHVVLAADRRAHLWDMELASTIQLAGGLVAVRPAGAPDEEATIVDPSSGLPFGEIPWWVGSTQGMLATKQGASSIHLPSSTAPNNLTLAAVDLRFSSDGSRLEADWECTSKGQAGLSRARALRVPRESNRQKMVEQLCGLGPDVEVAKSDHRVMPSMISQLECVTERIIGSMEESVGHFSMTWTGPWMEPLPDLVPGERVHPVVFDFPRVDVAELTIAPPPGFKPADAPPPMEISGRFGDYRLTMSTTPEGFRVERSLTFLPTKVPAEEYGMLVAFLDEVSHADSTRVKFTRVRDRPCD